jgi:hypothetical protein
VRALQKSAKEWPGLEFVLAFLRIGFMAVLSALPLDAGPAVADAANGARALAGAALGDGRCGDMGMGCLRQVRIKARLSSGFGLFGRAHNRTPASCASANAGVKVKPKITIPLAAGSAELKVEREVLEDEARKVLKEQKMRMARRRRSTERLEDQRPRSRFAGSLGCGHPRRHPLFGTFLVPPRKKHLALPPSA